MTRKSDIKAFKRDARALVPEQDYKVAEAARTPGINDNRINPYFSFPAMASTRSKAENSMV
ncbi:hypothetical protein [Oceanospirillum beijerinckii]|uniref:hypothetical protein n=1 Tax=Oceanospirillum beijerinckii TaxID=64976 RepID=UPI00055AC15E|nr:hypothetical protein [Oceanospirillum beijerinckii]